MLSFFKKVLSVTIYVLSIFFVLTGVTKAFTITNFFDEAYVGLDVSNCKVQFDSDYGERFFGKYVPQANLNVGFNFSEYFGLELGYESTFKNKVERAVVGGEPPFPGSNDRLRYFPATEFNKFSSYHKLNFPYIGLSANKEIIKNSKIFLMLGATYATVHARCMLIVNEEGGMPSQSVIDRNFFDFKGKKLIPMVKIGFKQKFNDYFGIKVFGDWKNTSRFKLDSKRDDGRGKVRFMDTFSAGIGVFFVVT